MAGILIDICWQKVSVSIWHQGPHTQYSDRVILGLRQPAQLQHQHKGKNWSRNLICKTYCLASTLLGDKYSFLLSKLKSAHTNIHFISRVKSVYQVIEQLTRLYKTNVCERAVCMFDKTIHVHVPNYKYPSQYVEALSVFNYFSCHKSVFFSTE